MRLDWPLHLVPWKVRRAVSRRGQSTGTRCGINQAVDRVYKVAARLHHLLGRPERGGDGADRRVGALLQKRFKLLGGVALLQELIVLKILEVFLTGWNQRLALRLVRRDEVGGRIAGKARRSYAADSKERWLHKLAGFLHPILGRVGLNSAGQRLVKVYIEFIRTGQRSARAHAGVDHRCARIEGARPALQVAVKTARHEVRSILQCDRPLVGRIVFPHRRADGVRRRDKQVAKHRAYARTICADALLLEFVQRCLVGEVGVPVGRGIAPVVHGHGILQSKLTGVFSLRLVFLESHILLRSHRRRDGSSGLRVRRSRQFFNVFVPQEFICGHCLGHGHSVIRGRAV